MTVSRLGVLAVWSVLAGFGLAQAQTSPQTGPQSGTQAGGSASADPLTGSPIPLELNKLEPVTQPAGCRVYLLTNNPDSEAIDQLRLDLILFGSDGVIARRVALDLGPLPARKQAVRLFDLQGLPCEDIAKVLVNDVIACARTPGNTGSAADHAACLDRLAPTSRTKAALTK